MPSLCAGAFARRLCCPASVWEHRACRRFCVNAGTPCFARSAVSPMRTLLAAGTLQTAFQCYVPGATRVLLPLGGCWIFSYLRLCGACCSLGCLLYGGVASQPALPLPLLPTYVAFSGTACLPCAYRLLRHAVFGWPCGDVCTTLFLPSDRCCSCRVFCVTRAVDIPAAILVRHLLVLCTAGWDVCCLRHRSLLRRRGWYSR